MVNRATVTEDGGRASSGIDFFRCPAFLEAEGSALIQRGPDSRPFITVDAIAGAAPAVARHSLRLLVEQATGRKGTSARVTVPSPSASP